MATSNTYNFGLTTNIDALITEAFERCGIVGDIVTAQMLQSAYRSLNLMISSWPNAGINLWTVEKGMIALVPNQCTYTLPPSTIDILEATIRNPIRQLSGTPSSSSGVAANAFDSDPQTACTQTAPNGFIRYDYGVNISQAIEMVGITSNSLQNYTLEVQISINGTDWTTVASPPLQSYPDDVLIWIAVESPIQAEFIQIIETGGATLDIQELYFSNVNSGANSDFGSEYILTRLSRSEYTAIPNKSDAQRPSSFYVNRLSTPNVTLWPTPDNEFPMLYYNAIRELQDIDLMVQNPDVPSRFLDSLTAGLAARLAVKFAIDRVDILENQYQKTFAEAFLQDTENVSIRIYPDMYGWH